MWYSPGDWSKAFEFYELKKYELNGREIAFETKDHRSLPPGVLRVSIRFPRDWTIGL